MSETYCEDESGRGDLSAFVVHESMNKAKGAALRHMFGDEPFKKARKSASARRNGKVKR